MAIKLPREGTQIREALNTWVLKYDGEISFSDFLALVSDSIHYGMYATKSLKRFGRKLGKSGDRSKWVVDGRVAIAIMRANAIATFESALAADLKTKIPVMKTVVTREFKVGDQVRFGHGVQNSVVRGLLAKVTKVLDERIDGYVGFEGEYLEGPYSGTTWHMSNISMRKNMVHVD